MRKVYILSAIIIFFYIGPRVYNYFTTSSVQLWPNGVIPYEFIGAFTEEEKKQIQDCMSELQMIAKIQFVYSPRKADPVYRIMKANKASYNTSTSSIGYNESGNYLYICDICVEKGTLMHELGHCLGLRHEHQRPDRDKYIFIIQENILNGFEHNFVKLAARDYPYPYKHFKYDYVSIMHYHSRVFAREKDVDVIIVLDGTPIRSQYLSELDKQKIQYLYGGK